MKKVRGKGCRKDEIPSLESLQRMQTSAAGATRVTRSRIEWAIIILKILIYIIGQTVAYLIEFGAVFFCLSLLYLIWCTLDDRKRAKNELSAYSVFNPNFEEIDGTVTADQLKKQITFGAL